MKTLKRINGMTLVEMIIAASMAAVVMGAFALLIGKNFAFFHRMEVRQQVMAHSRETLEIIQQALRNGKARTLVISTPPGAPTIPNSRIDFGFKTALASGATAYAIYQRGRDVFVKEYVPGVDRAPRVIASNVTALMFTGDYRDPGYVGVTLRMDAPWDNSGNPKNVSTIIVPNQIIHMADTP